MIPHMYLADLYHDIYPIDRDDINPYNGIFPKKEWMVIHLTNS